MLVSFVSEAVDSHFFPKNRPKKVVQKIFSANILLSWQGRHVVGGGGRKYRVPRAPANIVTALFLVMIEFGRINLND